MNNQLDKFSVGPGGLLELRMSPALSDLIRSHVKYQSSLSTWDQYIIWRYTIGSGQVNRSLIGMADEERIVFWVYQFFKYYNINHYGIDQIKPPFNKYKQYFITPRLYLKLNHDIKINIATAVLNSYIERLEQIILNSPPTTEDMVVIKVSSYYPELPLSLDQQSSSLVYQKPFNSTTYDPQLNFAPFLSPDFNCCLFVIYIPANSHVLAIDPSLHAYPHEREILIPFGSSFDIKTIDTDVIDYIPVTDQKFISIQSEPFVLGEVYRIDPLYTPNVLSKQITTYHSTLITPLLK